MRVRTLITLCSFDWGLKCSRIHICLCLALWEKQELCNKRRRNTMVHKQTLGHSWHCWTSDRFSFSILYVQTEFYTPQRHSGRLVVSGNFVSENAKYQLYFMRNSTGIMKRWCVQWMVPLWNHGFSCGLCPWAHFEWWCLGWFCKGRVIEG